MNTNKEFDQYQHGSNTSIKSIKDVKQKKNGTFFNSIFEKTWHIASEEETAETHIKQSFNTCDLNVQTDKENTENCLKRFKREYNDLMKQKNGKESTKICSIQNEVTETLSPNTKQIESSNFNERSPIEVVELLSSNLLDFNLNKIEGLVKPDDKSIHSLNDIPKKNIKTFPNKEFLKKCHNGYIVDTYKYQEKYNEELNECFNDTENIKMQQQEVLLSNITFHEMLDGLNNEIIKIKEQLTKNKEADSLSNSNNIINGSNETYTEEDFVIQDVGQKYPQNTIDVQTLEKYYTNHECCDERKLRQYIHSNQATQYSNAGHLNNLESTEEQLISQQQNEPERKTAEGFYQIQSLNDRTQDLIRIEHFFSWHNPHVCQCGMISSII